MPDRPAKTSILGDPHEWRPQRPLVSGRARAVTNAILEPLWDGDHVLLHFDARPETTEGEAGLSLIDQWGEPPESADPALVVELRLAIRAGDAVIDGFLTRQATRSPDTVSTAPMLRTSFSVMSGRKVDAEIAPMPEKEPTPIAFVAVDLLRVDGQDLFDVPLLERKRVLDSVVEPSERVRVSPYTQPPLDPWLRAWKAAGFRGAMLKAANSRYVPGRETEEWQEATVLGGR